MFSLALGILLSLYALFCMVLTLVWVLWKPFKTSGKVFNERQNNGKKDLSNFKKVELKGGTLESSLAITLIIPVRNEAENILNLLTDLEKQSYSKEYFEVLIANDNSTDDTQHIVEVFASQSKLKLHLINLSEKVNNTSPKKRAITECLNTMGNESSLNEN